MSKYNNLKEAVQEVERNIADAACRIVNLYAVVDRFSQWDQKEEAEFLDKLSCARKKWGSFFLSFRELPENRDFTDNKSKNIAVYAVSQALLMENHIQYLEDKLEMFLAREHATLQETHICKHEDLLNENP